MHCTKCVEIREAMEQSDAVYAYARAAFIHYALWIKDRERPYLDWPDMLGFLNETCVAQESQERHSGPGRRNSSGRTHGSLPATEHLFFSIGMSHLRQFENRTLTRPLVLLMTSGMEHVDIYGKWMQGRLEQGRDKEEILRGWTKRFLSGTEGAVR